MRWALYRVGSRPKTYRRALASYHPVTVKGFRFMERYYVKVKGSLGAQMPHDTLADAYAEARRLFELIGQSRRVYVLQVIGTIDPPEEPKPKKGPSRLTAVGSQRTMGRQGTEPHTR